MRFQRTPLRWYWPRREGCPGCWALPARVSGTVNRGELSTGSATRLWALSGAAGLVKPRRLRAEGLGLEVLAYDPYVDKAVMETLGVQVVDLETVLRRSDYISLHSPLTDETRLLINAETLALMKPTAFLVNAARGPLIDEDALLAAVQGGKIAGAALDVLEVEPVAPDHPFLKEERILLTPHAGWYSEESKIDVRVQGAEEVVRVLRGERPRAPVNEVPRE